MVRSASFAFASSTAEPLAKYTRAGGAPAVADAGGALMSVREIAALGAGADAATAAGSGFGLTVAPDVRLSAPSTTTTLFDSSPPVICQSSPTHEPTLTGRISTVFSLPTTQTK